MGDVYEEQQRYDQFLQQALGQGNADESRDLSFYNMNEQAQEASAQNKTLSEELAFTTLPGIIPHVFEIYQRATKLYDTFQEIKTKGQTVMKNLQTLPDDLKTLYKNKIDEIQGHLQEGTAKSYNLAREKYNQLKETGAKIGTNVLDKADALKTAGGKVVDTAKTSGEELLNQTKAKGEALLAQSRQQGIVFKQFVTEGSTASDKRNVLSNRATTPERQAEIASMSDEEVHTLFGKLPAGEYSVVKPTAGTSLLDQAKTAGGTLLEQAKTAVLEQAKTAGGTLLEQAKTAGGAGTSLLGQAKTAGTSLLEQAQATGATVSQTVKPTNLPDVELQDMTPSRQVTNPLYEGKTSAPYATEELYPQKVRVGFGEVPSYKGSQTGELGSSVPVLPTTKQAVPKIPSPTVAEEPSSFLSTASSALSGVMTVAGAAGGIAADVELAKSGGSLPPMEVAQLAMANVPLIQAVTAGASKVASMVGEAGDVASTVLPAVSTALNVVGEGAAVVGAAFSDAMLVEHGGTASQKAQTVLNNIPAVQAISKGVTGVKNALSETEQSVSSKATELSQQTEQLAPKVEEGLNAVKSGAAEGAEALAATGEAAAAEGTAIATSTLASVGEAVGATALSEAIPVVGQVIGLGTLIWGAITGLEGIFGHHDAPPPPQAVQEASIVHQAGI
jgi:hypothetical protein